MYIDTLSCLAGCLVLGISALLIVNNESSVADKLHNLFRHRGRRPYQPSDD